MLQPQMIDNNNLITWLIMACCMTLLFDATAEPGRLMNPESLDDRFNLPDTAIDTEQIPEFSLAPDTDLNTPLPVYQLTDNSYFLFGGIDTLNERNRGWNGNAGFVVTGEGVVVIDSLGTPQLGHRFIATIRSMTDQPIRYLIITHNHPDHAYGAAPFMALDGVKIIAHPGVEDYNRSATLQSSVDYREQTLPQDMQGFQPVRADISVETPRFGSITFTLGDITFQVFNTGKHHSYGDLVVYQQPQNIMWISDLAFNQRTTYMGDGHSKQILEAHKWLVERFSDVKLMVPGHGSAQRSPFPMLHRTNDYVKRMREAMQQAIDDGLSLHDAVQNIDFEDWQDSRLYEQNQRANANFVYREMEKAFFENF